MHDVMLIDLNKYVFQLAERPRLMWPVPSQNDIIYVCNCDPSRDPCLYLFVGMSGVVAITCDMCGWQYHAPVVMLKGQKTPLEIEHMTSTSTYIHIY